MRRVPAASRAFGATAAGTDYGLLVRQAHDLSELRSAPSLPGDTRAIGIHGSAYMRYEL